MKQLSIAKKKTKLFDTTKKFDYKYLIKKTWLYFIKKISKNFNLNEKIRFASIILIININCYIFFVNSMNDLSKKLFTIII